MSSAASSASSSGLSTAYLMDPSSDESDALADVSLIKILQEKLTKLYRQSAAALTQTATTKGIVRTSNSFEILVFGPARVGKSTLIGAIAEATEDEIKSGAGLDSVTQDTSCYVDRYNVSWYDTPGFENWEVKDAEKFFKDKFSNCNILPKVAIFCRTANVLARTDTVKWMFTKLRSHGILVIYCITKYPFIPDSEKGTIWEEACSLFGRASNHLVPIFQNRAYELIKGKAYIVPVNSKADTIIGRIVPKYGLNTLRKVMFTKLDPANQHKLVELYKENLGFWGKLGYGALDFSAFLGLDLSTVVLTAEELSVYNQLRDGPSRAINPQIVAAIISKLFTGK